MVFVSMWEARLQDEDSYGGSKPENTVLAVLMNKKPITCNLWLSIKISHFKYCSL